MCRLVAYVGAPVRGSLLVYGGAHPLYEQAWAPRELLHGTVNADGWGVAWYDDGAPVRLARSEPVWHATGLERLLTTVRTPVAVAALRNATPGLSLGPSEVPPLVHGRWVFALNGFVPDFRRRHMRSLRSRLDDARYGALVGSSDTETLFLLAVQALDGGARPAEALRTVVETVLGEVGPDGPECQLTMILADDRTVAACRSGNRDVVNSLYRLDRGRLAPEGTLLASERLDDDAGWCALPPYEVVEVSRPDRPPDPAPAR